MWYYSNETDESSILCGTVIFLVKKNSKRHLWTPDPQLYNFKLWSSPTLIYRPHKATFTDRSSQSEPIANVDGKRQTTSIFCDNISSEFLPIHLIYVGATDRCHISKISRVLSYHPKPESFGSIQVLSLSYYRKIIFRFLAK